MSTNTSPIIRDRRHAIWYTKPIPNSPRPWPLISLTLIFASLAIAGSIGPWLYTEDGPSRAREIETISGLATDGVFSLFFALTAVVPLLIVLLRPRLWGFAWLAFVALALCSLVGLFDWVVFDPMELTANRPQVVRVEWGLMLVTTASLVAASCSFLLARHLMDGDY